MNRLVRKITVLFITLGVALLTGCATQDEMFTLDDRLSSLEQRHEAADRERREIIARLNDLSAGRESDEQSLRSQSAALRVDIDTLREEIQQLNGRLEETVFALRQKMVSLEEADRKRQNEIARLAEVAEENNAGIQRIESYLNFEGSEPQAEKAPTAPGTAEPESAKKLPEDQLYALAKQAFDKGDLENARNQFTDLIKRFPKSGHADNAQFWIGESYYREKWYEKAILEYQKVIEKYPKGNKVRASLLKQGFAFLNLGDSANARLILKELIRKYPKSNEAAIARKKLKGMK